MGWPRLITQIVLAGFRVAWLRCVGLGVPGLGSARLGPTSLGLGLGPNGLGRPGRSPTGSGSAMPESVGLTLRGSEFIGLGPVCPDSVELGSMLSVMGPGDRAGSKRKGHSV